MITKFSNWFFGSFIRSLGRVFAYIFLGFLLYFVFDKLEIRKKIPSLGNMFGYVVHAESNVPELVGTIDSCYVSIIGSDPLSANCAVYSDSHNYIKVYIYHVLPNVEYSFTFLSGNRLRIFSSTESHYLVDNSIYCGNYMTNRKFVLKEESPVVNQDYSFISTQEYIYMYFGSSNNQVGSIQWQGQVIVEDPTIPSAIVPDEDFYLFYTFNDIKEFNIFEDYDFTSFTDFQKLCIVIGINILYLLFIGCSIYILLKAMNKLISWVFR